MVITLKWGHAIELLHKLQDRLAPVLGWEFIGLPFRVQATVGRSGAKSFPGLRPGFSMTSCHAPCRCEVQWQLGPTAG